MSKSPLWQVLVDRGLVADRKEAAGWILAGRVTVNGQCLDKEGAPVPAGAEVRVRGLELRYVSRGGLKLEGALADLRVDVAGRVTLDAGASTGGFTDCLLQHGVARVYAVDAGFGQLAGKLRCDPRVANLERTNIGDLTADRLNPRPEVATVDLSYLSLKKAVPILAPILAPGGEMLCLVKPLFEAADPEARRTGRISDPAIYGEVLQDLVAFMPGVGLTPIGVAASRIRGSGGTCEFFLHLSRSAPAEPPDLLQRIERAVAACP